MAYSSIAKPTDHFNTVLYTGNSTTDTGITGVGFQPDWLWVKSRGAAESHFLQDAVRGATKSLKSESTAAEGTDAQNIKSFDSDGFTLGSNDGVNDSGFNYVSWNWLAGNGTASNSNGATTSTVSANTTAGFSIVSWTGAGSATTVGHGLGAAPQVVLVKNRSEVYGWQMYHASLGNTKYVSINNTDNAATSSQSWNDTSPTSTVFTVGASDSNNKSGNSIIAYCFTEKKGYSKFGSYTGNGNADGTFVYTGFKPAWLIIKPLTTASHRMWDNKREDYTGNVNQTTINANETGAEYDNSSVAIDFLSNGFKGRSSGSDISGSSVSYIYMAFAENPFVGNDSGTAVPGMAR